MLHGLMCQHPCLCINVHTFLWRAGSIVCRALHLKHINEGGSALRSKHAVPQTKEP